MRDAWASMENPGSPEADRWRKSQAMGRDPAFLRAGMARLSRTMASAPDPAVMAAPGTTLTETALVPPTWLPGRYVPLLGAKAPLYTALTKLGVPDFTTLEVPRTATETGLSGIAADEVTPIAPGTITTTNDTVTIGEVEGSYEFSRKLLMGSNPQIDRIALDALDRAWLAQVETEAVTYFVGGANVHTAVAVNYTDGPTYIGRPASPVRGHEHRHPVHARRWSSRLPKSTRRLRHRQRQHRLGRCCRTRPQFNSSGESSAGYASVAVQGIPLMPGPYMTATHTLILDQDRSSAVIFATPVMDFRLEWTTDTTTGGNVKVLKLVKYSGVGFWAQYPGGIILLTNGTPLALSGGDAHGNGGETRAAAKK